MHQKKSKKILLYFFLLILVGSINNSTIKDFKFEKIKYLEVSGLNKFYTNMILKNIDELKLENIFFLKKKELAEVIHSNPLVENYNIFKKYPSTLEIKIEETNLIAKINNNGKTFYIGTNGKLSEKNFSDKLLPFIFGKPSVEEFLRFKLNVDQSKFSYEEIKNIYFFPSKRWDIQLRNNLLIKIPKEDITNSLDEIFFFLQNNNFNSLKIIDARVKNQIILND